MRFDAKQILGTAVTLGFRADSLEKAFRLLSLLDALHSNAFLRPRVALKGGTALNLFHFDVPRLSVDIDLNYIGSADRVTMLKERPLVEQAIAAVCAREALTVKRVPDDHAGGKWRLSYVTHAGMTDTLEIDLNFMLRVPLWPVVALDSKPLGAAQAKGIAVVDRHELAAGKLAALCSRNAARDLFDTRELLRRGDLDRGKLRLAFVVYGGVNRKDWRTVRVEDIAADPTELNRELIPMLRAEVRPRRSDVLPWTEALVAETRKLLEQVLPLEAHEFEFIERLNGSGEIAAELLTVDGLMQAAIRAQPGLMWKAQNVKSHMAAGADASKDRPERK